ncbi:ABC transporter ATP-binding protein [Clostridium sp. 'deep sea']|uniref:ABC transporter ATP-binding protein n=1 Tax=Clostridium sp. 'deep sea' TaxID=2779445 RepID=UPI0018965E98|nr:ABC transporter ATP-binding protein [Clostridium sp. 'deep sea']QOR35062.1 ABC transporter ATP-binding protein [Clostridium sp. 'deep sea']
MKAIEIKNLTKKYKEHCAVNSLNLSIKKGEFFALLGQNGAGKTTTIKMLCCLLTATSGDAILLGDSIINNSEAVKQKINVSPQETAVAPNLTVKENLEMFAQIYGSNKKQAKQKASEMIKTFSLSEKANTRAKSLSGGMQRRLSIALALISNPQIIFLDEPTLGLDVRARRELWKHIKSLKGKITIVLTTHYLEEAEALADRIAIMHNGNLQALGTVNEIKEQTNEQSLEEAFLKLTDMEVI